MAIRRCIVGCCARATTGQPAAPVARSVMNSRLFNRSNCIRWPNQLRAGYRIGEERVSTLLHCEILTWLTSELGHSRHSRHPGVSGLPRERSVFWAARPPGLPLRKAAGAFSGPKNRQVPATLPSLRNGRGSYRWQNRLARVAARSYIVE
jgi:hypothetical protein